LFYFVAQQQEKAHTLNRSQRAMITAPLIMLTSMAGTLNQLESAPQHVFMGRLFPILLSIFKKAKREFSP